MKFVLVTVWFVLIQSFTIIGQRGFEVSGDIFGNRVFIENKGQFDAVIPHQKGINYAYLNGKEQVYFDQHGLTYVLEDKKPLTEEQREDMEHGRKIQVEPPQVAYVHLNWEGANEQIELVAEEQQAFYHSFGDARYKSNCFKKLIYKNVYNHIDVEYVLPNEKEYGIKYNVILHPGARVEDVKLRYSGDVKRVRLKKENVVIETPITNITELAPVSYQDGMNVGSRFVIKDQLISFELPQGYDQNKKLIIDPWVVAYKPSTNIDIGYDVDYDNAGNYYVYGGSGPLISLLIAKYNPAGSLLWVFNGEVPSISWPLQDTPAYFSAEIPANFVVDKLTGKVYTGEGFNKSGSGTRIIRLDQRGLYDNFVSTGSPLWNELSDMGFDCSGEKLYGIGGSTASNLTAGILDTVSGIINPKSFFGYGPDSIQQDVTSHAIDPSGRIFFIFVSRPSVTVRNKLVKVNASFTGNDWIVPSGYGTFFEATNKFYYPDLYLKCSSNGFNALAANDNYLYYYDGLNLAAYNKANGAKLGATTCPGLGARAQGGIAVDDCDNVYVGGHGAILGYHFNGAVFSSNGNIPIGSNVTYKTITDIKLDKNTNLLYVSGAEFGGVYPAIHSLTCHQLSVTPSCHSAVASVTTTILSPVFSYTWSDAGGVVSTTENSSLPTNTVTGLSVGSYTVRVQLNKPCGPILTQTFTIGSYTTTIATTTASCSALGSATASTAGGTAPFSYTWTGSVSSNSVAADLPVGHHTLTIADAGACAQTHTFTIGGHGNPTLTITGNAAICSGGSASLTPSGAASYTWSGGVSMSSVAVVNPSTTTTYTVIGTDASGCSSTKTVTVTVGSSIPITITGNTAICNGNSTTLTASGALTYSWSGGISSASLAVVSPTANTTYTVTGTDAAGCAGSQTVMVIVNAIPTLTISGNMTVCSGNSTTLTAYGAMTYTWAGGISSFSLAVVNPTLSTTYTVDGTDVNGCAGTQTAIVIVNVIPTLTINGNNSICLGNGTTLTATGATTYTWIGVSTSSAVAVSPTMNTTYTVIGADLSGCSSINTVTVHVNPTPTLTITGNTTICSGSSTTLTASGANTYTWIGISSSSLAVVSPTTNTTYTLIGSDASGCFGSQTVTVKVNPSPTLTINGNTNICSGTSTTLTASGANTYTWVGVASTSSIAVVSPTLNSTYTVIGADASVCPGTQTVMVTVNALPTLTITGNNSICLGNSTLLTANGANTYTWVGVSTSSTIAVSPSINTTYTAIGIDASGCSNTQTIMVTVNALPTLTITGNTTICEGAYTTLTVSGAASYVWNTSNPTATLTVNPLVTTSYSVRGTDVNGCLGFQTEAVTVIPIPPISATGNTLTCLSPTVTLNGSGGGSYIWAGPGIVSGNNTATPKVALPGNYTLTVTDANGCYNTLVANVANQLVYAQAGFMANPEKGPAPLSVSFTNLSTNAFVFQWVFGDGSVSVERNPQHVFGTEGEYQVYLIAGIGACADTASVRVHVEPEFLFYIPNSFSPNQDGVNDVFTGKGIGISKFELWVFDRWGTAIFYSNDIFKGWDGSIYGKEVKQDVYTWKINITDVNAKKHSYVGHVTLLK